MRPGTGVVRKAPDDGVLRGRDGAKRWLCQISFLMFLAFVLLILVIVGFASQQLVLVIVWVLLGCLVAAILRTWFYPLAWVGLDMSVPVIFDLGADGLEIGFFRQFLFQSRVVPKVALRDIRVYRAAVDFSGDKGVCYDEPEPLKEDQTAALALELPRLTDAARECVRSLWLCCSASRPAPGVACAFLAAKIENDRGDEEMIQLSRCAWFMRDVERLGVLAQEARSRSGMQEKAEPGATVVGAPAGAAPKTEDKASLPKAGSPKAGGGSPTNSNSQEQSWTMV